MDKKLKTQPSWSEETKLNYKTEKIEVSEVKQIKTEWIPQPSWSEETKK